MSSASQSVVQRGYDCFSKGDLDSLLATLTEDVEWSVVGPPDAFSLFGDRTGRDGAAEYFRLVGETLDITEFSPTRFLVDGDTVVVLGHSDGIVRKTGRAIRNKWVHVFTVRGDQISRFEEFVDSTVVMEVLQAA